MGNGHKRIAIFGSCFSGRYRKELVRAFNIAAEELGVDLYYFNSLGKIGNINALYIDYEADILDHIDLSPFDGIVFDGDGYNVDGMVDKIIRRLRDSKCPVVSISTRVDGFYNIILDDADGLRMMAEHFLDHHKFTKIGFMSGYLTHPDARRRLEEFRSVMRGHGLPEDGVGMFEGDFWFNKGEEAADYFLSLPERPEAIVCANDYMAISLIEALKKRGIRTPDDIAVSGFDGAYEGQEFLPHLTTVSRERLPLARKSLKLLLDIAETGHTDEKDLHIPPQPVFSQSCGCAPLDYKVEAEHMNFVYSQYNGFIVNVHDSEASMLKLNRANDVRTLENVFADNSFNFGDYSAFFMMLHTDSEGRPSYDSDFTSPTGKFTPAMWIDKKKEYARSGRGFDSTYLFPEPTSDKCHFYYITCMHWAGKIFGYSVIEMAGKEIYSEFYNVWLLNISMTLDAFQKNDHIRKLIGKLENLSTADELTGMLNRRGFETRSRDAITSVRGRKNVCTMVIDMDGLKHINDVYGHNEGDRAIRSAANIITACCDSGEIAGRAGGDEFYIFASDYSETLLKRFTERLKKGITAHNETSSCPYKIDMSFGAYLVETDRCGRLEDFLRVSDTRMYEQKLSKRGRRE